NKCASGTGEFFRQQLGRMGLDLTELNDVASGATVHKISSRCSVFMKSDCTHKLNKGEATKGDIALSLSKVMADKISEFLIKARISSDEVVLIGGVIQNRFIVQFLQDRWPNVKFVIPKEAPYFEAFGAAHLARERGSQMPGRDGIINDDNGLNYGRFASLKETVKNVRYLPSARGDYDPHAEYILGVDGGSTTTKITLVNAKTLEIVASHYGRTHGDPIASLKLCIEAVRKDLGKDANPKIVLTATTGSSRELLGTFLETPGVYNEIIAHTYGTTHYEPKVDTIFEIGGQDAKYVSINNSVPVDYAMNEACSAGTGSFLEESASGDLNIKSAHEIGPLALAADGPLKFGEHCSAFINSDIRQAVSQGAGKNDIVGGLVFSIVANYLNRVVGNRLIGDYVMLQGGVAKNPAVPLAFAEMMGKEIVVPPDPELMGAFGVARLVKEKAEQGFIDKTEFNFDDILNADIKYRNTFVCKVCDNFCEIKNIEVRGRRYPFGGRCSLYTNKRKKRSIDEAEVVDYTTVRQQMVFEDFAPNVDDFISRSDKVVGVPRTFSIHSLWPFYSHFFHYLGVRTFLTDDIKQEGLAKMESNYCFPTEIAHGAVQDALDRGADYVFLPHFRDMPSDEKGEVHATTCPLTQGLPYMMRHAFNLSDEKMIKPLVSFKHGLGSSRVAFEEVAEQLGFSSEDGAMAYNAAIDVYKRFVHAYKELGAKVMSEVQDNPDRNYVVLAGRPYNAFTGDANMGIPRKFTSQGITIIPYDMVYL
ncbi:activase, partial [Myxococcota bacterium]|nr:activase [Myxococcota bacterium]